MFYEQGTHVWRVKPRPLEHCGRVGRFIQPASYSTRFVFNPLRIQPASYPTCFVFNPLDIQPASHSTRFVFNMLRIQPLRIQSASPPEKKLSKGSRIWGTGWNLGYSCLEGGNGMQEIGPCRSRSDEDFPETFLSQEQTFRHDCTGVPRS